jgi:hypothetical protein
MIFQHSAITTVTPFVSTEEASRPLKDVHPVFLGSGLVAFGIDAIGMQGLDARVMERPEVVSLKHMSTHLSDDLQIYHAGTLSMHHRLEADTFAKGNPTPWHDSWFLLPAGFFEYVLTIDGRRFDAEAIAAAASGWKRQFEPAAGTCRVWFTLAGIEFAWTIVIGHGSTALHYDLTATSADGRAHAVAIELCVHLKTRRGEEIASGGLREEFDAQRAILRWDARNDTSRAVVKEPYPISWAIATSRPGKAAWTKPTLSMTCDLPVDAREPASLAIAFDFRARRPIDSIDPPKPGDTAAAAESWRRLFAESARFTVGDPHMEFVHRVQQYLLLGGADWSLGVPANLLWAQNFMGSMFWDQYFFIDGMLRSGHVEQVRQAIQWLAERALQKDGRPYYWVHYYDGTPWRTNDVAYQVMAAHAACAIRYYEFTRDAEALRKWVWPIVSRVAIWSRQNLLGLHRGQWRFKVIVSGDVIGDDVEGTEETGVLAWIVVSMAKTLEYAKILKINDPELPRLAEVVEQAKKDKYDWSKPVMWWSWLPYISGAEPFYDAASWKRGIADALTGEGIAHLRHNDIGQPWGAFSVATSMLMTGLPNAGLRFIEEGLHQVYGHGAFCEFRYDKLENAGIAPFPTAAGSYLSAIGAIFCHGTSWDDSIRILDALPTTWQSRPIDFADFRTPNGARVSGRSEPDRVSLSIDTDRLRRVRLGVPVRLLGVPLRLTVGGKTVSFALSKDLKTIEFDLPQGQHAVELAEDVERTFETIIFEPKYRGRLFLELLTGAGINARLVRDPRALGDRLRCAKRLLLPSSMIQLPAYLVDAVEAFVRGGGTLVALHHAGCSEVNPRLASLLGVNAQTPDRFASIFAPMPVVKAMDHALADGLPEGFVIQETDRLATPHLAPDALVLLKDGETGHAWMTLRKLGHGTAIWLAPGQEAAGQKARKYSMYDAIDWLGERADEWFSYPYLESPHFRTLLVRCLSEAK